MDMCRQHGKTFHGWDELNLWNLLSQDITEMNNLGGIKEFATSLRVVSSQTLCRLKLIMTKSVQHNLIIRQG